MYNQDRGVLFGFFINSFQVVASVEPATKNKDVCNYQTWNNFPTQVLLLLSELLAAILAASVAYTYSLRYRAFCQQCLKPLSTRHYRYNDNSDTVKVSNLYGLIPTQPCVNEDFPSAETQHATSNRQLVHQIHRDCYSDSVGAGQTPHQQLPYIQTTYRTLNREQSVIIFPPTWANRVRFPTGPFPGLSHVGIVPDDAAGRRVFSGISSFLRPCIPALLRTPLDGSQDLDIKIRLNLLALHPLHVLERSSTIELRSLREEGRAR
ncbi:hypothetical protein PR048_029285 [Dryococelus australis]|uniref:Uncharacterized protein n=1 Tax=Dryococelus australis TaxID=614101 RepID=A0ABQ9GD01_9NEOP|nr:hypothetical protein PR048_029285 [Dryococelus australis]